MSAISPTMTCISQAITIGPGLASDTFHFLKYGDYGDYYPSNISAVDVPDMVNTFLAATKKTGWNLVVERLGYSTTALNNKLMLNELNNLIQRVEQDLWRLLQ